ncbi:MAG: sensor domain-containing protein [Rhizomicrobium sp.]
MTTTTVLPPETIAGYLRQLRDALMGATPGLIADALADCEDHLRGELASKPERSEADMLRAVIESYGTPAEVAEEYRSREATIAGPFPAPKSLKGRQRGFFGVLGDPRAYGALIYMLLSLVTGIFFFVWAVTGLALSAALFILIIGIPFALLFIASVRVLSLVEGRIVEGLLGVRMPRRLPPAGANDYGLGSRIKNALLDVRTWSSLFYLVLMLPLGVAYSVCAIIGLTFSLGFAGTALWGLLTNQSHFTVGDVPWLNHLLHTAPGLILMVVVGALLFIALLHLARAVGWLHARIAETLLVRI